jgi:hypothetical protein
MDNKNITNENKELQNKIENINKDNEELNEIFMNEIKEKDKNLEDKNI